MINESDNSVNIYILNQLKNFFSKGAYWAWYLIMKQILTVKQAYRYEHVYIENAKCRHRHTFILQRVYTVLTLIKTEFMDYISTIWEVWLKHETNLRLIQLFS